jgi:hypothetical protein
MFSAIPFSRFMSQNQFQAAWLRYNTELFRPGPLDDLEIDAKWFVPVVLRQRALSPAVAQVLGSMFHGRSLYSYDFTALSQDVLGQAYEQFLAHELADGSGCTVVLVETPATRKREGIFYTPSWVVRHIIRRALEPRVAPVLERARALLGQGQFAAAYDEAARILEVRVVDPACGSGSFLQAALGYLADALEEYNRAASAAALAQAGDARGRGLFDRGEIARLFNDPVEHVLVQCIFGVDLDAEAVDLAKLSLWTALLTSRPGYYGAGRSMRTGESAHLPVLSLNVRQGDAILSDIEARNPADAARVSAGCRVARDPAREDAARIAAARDAEAAIEGARDGSAFSWGLEFADVFAPRADGSVGGFDVVVGNPPYFNVDATWGAGDPRLGALRARYPDVYADKSDVLFYFLRRAADLLAPGGSLGFIVSRAFLQAEKAAGLRRFLRDRTSIGEVLDFLGHRVFHAGIATAIVTYRKVPPEAGHPIRVYGALDFARVRQALALAADPPADAGIAFTAIQGELGDERWDLSPYQGVFEQMGRSARPLGNLLATGKGMETGANDAFVFDRPPGHLPAERLRRRASTDNLHPFEAVDSGERVLWVEDSPFESIPAPVRQHLESHRPALEARAAFARGNCAWYQFTWPLHAERHFGPKVMAPYRARGARFAVDEDGGWIGLTNTTHVFCRSGDEAHAVCALLNSLPLDFRFRALGGLGKLTGKDMYEYFENQVADLPLPPLDGEAGRELAALSRRAHALATARRAQRASWASHARGLALAVPSTLGRLLDPAHPHYSRVCSSRSPAGPVEGEIHGFRVRVTRDGFVLAALVAAAGLGEADAEWVEAATVESARPSLRNFMLAGAMDAAEGDARDMLRPARAATGPVHPRSMAAVAIAEFDAADAARNLAIIGTVERRVATEVGDADLHATALEWVRVRQEIDDLACELLGVAEHAPAMRAALDDER